MTRLQMTFGLFIASMLDGLSRTSPRRDEGQTLAEYAMILAFVAVLVVGAVLTVQGKVGGMFTSIGSSI
jgi:Flp pilus assembly pilin Flp